jgi:hypothetical protein
VVPLKQLAGTHDVVLLVLDTLRFDVAVGELAAGRTPNLAGLVGQWEKHHAPGTFTYASHAAFFAGFFPTPARPGRHPRSVALAFPGAETIGENTLVLDAPSVPEGMRDLGYHTACIGGVGFFRLDSPLGRALPSLFAERVFRPEMGVTSPRSTEHQFTAACEILAREEKRVFLFINVSALHQPNRGYLPGAVEDSLETHAAALRYVDSCLPPLVAAVRARGPSVWLVGSDHGTCYGEDGYSGHRFAHPSVLEVPWAEVVLP